jgi:HlyD family type I secretion membrane fusion protein
MSIVKSGLSTLSDSSDQDFLSFESPTAEVLARYHSWKERAVLYVLAALIGALLVYISVVHLERVVVAAGRVVPVAGTLTVQPLEKAIISRIWVSVGQVVKKGQVLATCDPTFTQANLAQLQQKVANLDAQKRRMEAEEAGRPFRAGPAQAFDVLQASIRDHRRTEFDSGVTDFDQRISGYEAQIAGLRQSIVDYQARLKIARQTESTFAELVKSQAISQLQLTTAQDQRLDLEGKIAQAEGQLATDLHLVESLREQRKGYIGSWHNDNLSNLVTVKDDLEEARDDLIKAKRLSELVDLVSPLDAVVLRIPTLSTGGVATDAEPLFSLMPLDAPLEVDAQIDSKDSGFVKVGDPVTIKFDAFKFLEHGTGQGVVKMISQNSFTDVASDDIVSKGADREKRAPYYEARITMTGWHLHNVPPHVRLIPGMTLQADIIVGRRTILWYLLGGAMRSGAEAMHEP